MGRPKGKRASKSNKSPPAIMKRQKAKDKASKQVAALFKTELEPDPHGQYGILNYFYNETGESLENQVKCLKERVRDLEIYVRNTIRTADWLEGDFFEWSIILPHHFPFEFGANFGLTWNLAQNFAIDDIAVLSKRQKQQVVASLEGWLVQEDLDSIHARLQPGLQARLGKALVEAFLNKTVIDIMFRHPFWYLAENADEADSDEIGMEYAQVWRSITTRLCNSVRIAQTDDYTLGKAIKARRDARCKALAADLLSNKALLSLLSPVKDPAQRLHAFTMVLQQISQSAVDMIAQIPRLNFHTLGDIGMGFSADIMQVDYDSVPKDGHRVLGLTRPYVFRTINEDEVEEEIVLVAKAEALIADKMSDDERRRTKKPKV
ncbi:uncharacterized protein DSM5745_09249 [Aspergillus mulundensis]|uniref:Uncharacterized protein n=1 Tax=Aspergillus mulundensis TaxID=1810919 RepID=A0A3D8QZZ6_9EURO|nr:hypothetical protein DSM5745_09249 [Aspergillus mulundensis]RDW67383.1 hypothetical protein DSM5745_09249 [Aspergillus mulundensis]